MSVSFPKLCSFASSKILPPFFTRLLNNTTIHSICQTQKSAIHRFPLPSRLPPSCLPQWSPVLSSPPSQTVPCPLCPACPQACTAPGALTMPFHYTPVFLPLLFHGRGCLLCVTKVLSLVQAISFSAWLVPQAPPSIPQPCSQPHLLPIGLLTTPHTHSVQPVTIN